MKKPSRNKKRTRKQRGGSLLTNANAVRVQGPQANFTVSFGSTNASNTGIEIPLEQSQTQPNVTWAPQSNLYTIVCWDPDAPAKSWLHWLIINCSTDLDSGETLQSWSPPSPPSGTHRYIFGLFQQSGKLSISSPNQAGFQLTQFVKQNGLTPLAYKGIKVRSVIPST